MPIEIVDCIQGEDAWHRARLGLPTASEFATVRAKGKSGGESLTRAKYLRTLAAEIITGEPAEGYTNGFMERGKAQEAQARRMYAFLHDAEPELVGFIRNGSKGCSPDALIGTNGLLEIKTRMGHLQVELLLSGRFPAEHVAQVQGGLWVTEREWCDLAVYSPGLPLWVGRAYRDEEYIRELSDEVDRFNEELARIVEKVRSYGAAPTSFAEQIAASAAA